MSGHSLPAPSLTHGYSAIPARHGSDTHLATNNLNRLSANVGWTSREMLTTRGPGVVASDAVATVAGPTAGLEITKTDRVEWISPPISADVTISGTITINIWGRESANAANVAINAVIQVIRADALATVNSNTLVTIATTARTTELSPSATTNAVNNFTVAPSSTAVNRGDRIRLTIYGDDSTANMGSGQTFQIGYSGTTGAANGDTFITFTETFSFESAPAGSQIFLTDTASDVVTASVDREAWTTAGTSMVSDVTDTATGWTAPIQVTDTAGSTVVDWFTKQLTAFTLTGMATATLRALESNLAANASMRCEIARVESDGTSPTVWASWCCRGPVGNGELNTVEAAVTGSISGDDLAISNGQRLRIRLYVEDMSSAALVTGHTVTFRYSGTLAGVTGYSYVTLAQSVTEFVSGGAVDDQLEITLQAVSRSSVY